MMIMKLSIFVAVIVPAVVMFQDRPQRERCIGTNNSEHRDDGWLNAAVAILQDNKAALAVANH